jgi:hypothetical protein
MPTPMTVAGRAGQAVWWWRSDAVGGSMLSRTAKTIAHGL